MTSLKGDFIARGRTDFDMRLVEAQEPLATLQQRCGGQIPGDLAIPELREMVAKALESQLKLARTVTAFDGEELVSAWIEVTPARRGGKGGCFIGVASWKAVALPPESEGAALARKQDIDRSVAELFARLDAKQNILTVESEVRDLADVTARMREARGSPWTDFVVFPGNSHAQPLHWRLLDGSQCRVDGSDRLWTASLVPLGQPEPGSQGFELYLVADRSLPDAPKPASDAKPETMRSIGRDLSPVLRRPIARIIANAETIKAKMAGPLPEEYRAYAADIASAGQHLLSLIEDLADLEVVESDSFSTAPDRIDASDVARRACGILGVRAQERAITLVPPGEAVKAPATAEFRRVLQILLNLVGNAIRYSPEGSQVTITAESDDAQTKVTVADQGPGLSDAQQDVVFEKFERLGRSGDGGSGLGLYISRRIARAMGGDLTVDSAPGEGARFVLALPASVEG